jgi:hypothetical protein
LREFTEGEAVEEDCVVRQTVEQMDLIEESEKQ